MRISTAGMLMRSAPHVVLDHKRHDGFGSPFDSGKLLMIREVLQKYWNPGQLTEVSAREQRAHQEK